MFADVIRSKAVEEPTTAFLCNLSVQWMNEWMFFLLTPLISYPVAVIKCPNKSTRDERASSVYSSRVESITRKSRGKNLKQLFTSTVKNREGMNTCMGTFSSLFFFFYIVQDQIRKIVLPTFMIPPNTWINLI